MKREMLMLTLIAFSTLLLVPVVTAQIEPITAWTDKSMYSPGEKGTLHIAFRNTRGYGVKVENVSVTYTNWQAYIGGEWVGNETIIVDEDVGKGEIHTIDVAFTVPSDGRGESTWVDIEVGTDFGYVGTTMYPAWIDVVETPSYMAQIVTLFTILVVLVIVCTIIVAATVFLSARRPQMTWREVERAPKTE